MKSDIQSLSVAVIASMGLLAGATLPNKASAGGTTTVTVNAKVKGACKVTSAPNTLDFGMIDPTGTANAVATTTFVMQCSKGITSTAATDDNGLHFAGGTKQMELSSGGSFLPYSIGYSGDSGFTGAGFGSGAASKAVTVTGTITPAQYSNATATAGSQVYTDTVTITVNP
ncbi:MAG: spore coat protein U domain-containing protein [Burkholderiaceae bacterium]|nr:spore coat protein U domain-containing protein [Burkholderiaceae bacterium]